MKSGREKKIEEMAHVYYIALFAEVWCWRTVRYTEAGHNLDQRRSVRRIARMCKILLSS